MVRIPSLGIEESNDGFVRRRCCIVVVAASINANFPSGNIIIALNLLFSCLVDNEKNGCREDLNLLLQHKHEMLPKFNEKIGKMQNST